MYQGKLKYSRVNMFLYAGRLNITNLADYIVFDFFCYSAGLDDLKRQQELEHQVSAPLKYY